MGATATRTTSDVIVDTVVDLLEEGGYDAVQLRAVARRARVSLATIYKQFANRNELVVSAMERWMAENAYARLPSPRPGDSLYDGLMGIYRAIFEPWEQHPHLLVAYHRARTGPGGDRLDRQGMPLVEPLVQTMLAEADPEYAADVGLVLVNMSYAVLGRFTDGDLAVSDILPTLERAVFRLTAGQTAAGRTRTQASSVRR